jgi:hypothetical protein
MYSKFEFKKIPLKDISLDDRNPRIVSQTKLTSQTKILEYLFEYEDLLEFVQKIAAEGKNHGAERPYVVASGSNYTVIEGNTRVAAYKILTGLIEAKNHFPAGVPHISDEVKKEMLALDCSISPN